ARVQRRRAAHHEALDGARPRARQPHRAAVARRQGGRAGPPARRADADARVHVCRSQALRHGNADMMRLLLLPLLLTAFPAAGDTSGIYVAKLFQQLGIASQMQPKSVLVRGGLAAERVARGEAEIALQQASELRLVPSVKFAGMLPAEVQNWTVYAGALSPAARTKDAALSLMSVLSDPGLEPILRKRGLDTP